MTTKTIAQTAKYFYTSDGQDLEHGAAYLPLHPDYGAEFEGVNQDGTENWSIDGVVAPEAIEQLFDTDSHVLSYYQVAPLVYE